MVMVKDYKDLFTGQNYMVPVIDNKYETYINLDNAATTPPFTRVMNKINEFSAIYSSIHRGNGFKSMLTTDIFEQARNSALELVNADLTKNTAVFVRNSTEAINMLSRLYQMKENDIIISSRMEHHSNDLPWRRCGNVKYIDITQEGELDFDHFMHLMNTHRGKVKLVTITGASNVTGYINSIHKMAKITHEVGAKIFVDASQLVPHRLLDIKGDNNIEHIDFVAYTSHKMYAPFGIGVLVGPRDFFNSIEPDNIGGGSVTMVTKEVVLWAETPVKNEAGTPNVMGAVALAAAIKQIKMLGYHNIEEHELSLTNYLLNGLKKIEGIKIYGCPEADIKKRLGNLGKYFVGGMAYHFNRGILKERSVADRHNGKANDTDTLIVLLTSLALSLLKPNSKIIKEKVILGAMLPTEEYFKNKKENVKIFEDKLKGVHRVKFLHPVFNGVEVEFEIVGVSTQPEGLCAMNAIMYDDDGNLLTEYEKNYSERTILGFDIGALTSDVTVVHDFELRTFFGIDKGTIDPLNRIIDHIKTEYKVTLPRHKLDNAIIRNEKLLIYGEEIPDFNIICKEYIDYEARQLVDEFSSKAAAAGIQLPDIGLLILCGGGSLLFKDVIKKILNRIPMIFSENAIMLNAIGAWKNANRLKNDLYEESTLDYSISSHI